MTTDLAVAAEMGSDTRRLLGRALPLGILSFVVSAVDNILPQVQLLERHPADKDWLLSVLLLTGTVAGMAGVWTARVGVPRVHRRSHRLVLSVALLGVTGAALAAMFVVTPVLPYGALNAMVCFGSNLMTQWLDVAAHRMAGPSARQRNDRFTMVARLVGMLLGPVVFALYHEAGGATLGIGVLVLVAAVAAVPMSRAQVPAVSARSAGRRGSPAERRILRYAFLMWVALYLVAANLVYLLRDMLHMDRPVLRGGITTALVFASSAVLIALQPLAAARLGVLTVDRPVRSLWLTPGVVIVAAALSMTLERVSFWAVLAFAVLIGASYGAFMIGVRDWVSSAEARGSTGFLARFNNLANVSAITAFTLALITAAVARWAALPYYPALLVVIILTSVVAAVCLPRAPARRLPMR